MIPALDAAAPAARFRRWMGGRSLAQCVDDKRDNILLLRLVAALLVVFGHSVLAGRGSPIYQGIREALPATPLHVVGLLMFFATSGFLITLSFERRPELLRFLRARFLRLWPALAVCVVLWAFVLGPLLSNLPVPAYFSADRPDNPYAYAAYTASFADMGRLLPGVFEHNPIIPKVVNSSLWTIPVEATMYLYVGAAGSLRLLRLRVLTSAILAVGLVVVVAWTLATGRGTEVPLGLLVQSAFAVGAIACLLRRHVSVSTGIMLVAALACAAASHTRWTQLANMLAIAYFVLWFSYVPRLPRVPHDWDLSYGIYLWAWPVQQAFVQAGVRDPFVLFAIVTPILLAVATESWLGIERPALTLKDARWWRRNEVAPAGA